MPGRGRPARRKRDLGCDGRTRREHLLKMMHHMLMLLCPAWARLRTPWARVRRAAGCGPGWEIDVVAGVNPVKVPGSLVELGVSLFEI